MVGLLLANQNLDIKSKDISLLRLSSTRQGDSGLGLKLGLDLPNGISIAKNRSV